MYGPDGIIYLNNPNYYFQLSMFKRTIFVMMMLQLSVCNGMRNAFQASYNKQPESMADLMKSGGPGIDRVEGVAAKMLRPYNWLMKTQYFGKDKRFSLL